MDFALRKWELSDAESICNYANMQADEHKQFCRAVVIQGEAVGSIGAFFQEDIYRKNAEIAYWLGEPFWWKGVMSCAIRQVCASLFEQYDIARVYAQPYAVNAASRRALEKAGFRLEGIMKKSVYKNSTLMDSCMYALLK